MYSYEKSIKGIGSYTKPELVEICKILGISSEGKKEILYETIKSHLEF